MHGRRRATETACKASCSGACPGVQWREKGTTVRECYKCTNAATGKAENSYTVHRRKLTGATVATECAYCASTEKAFASWTTCPCTQGLGATGSDAACTTKTAAKCAQGKYTTRPTRPAPPATWASVSKFQDKQGMQTCISCQVGKYTPARRHACRAPAASTSSSPASTPRTSTAPRASTVPSTANTANTAPRRAPRRAAAQLRSAAARARPVGHGNQR